MYALQVNHVRDGQCQTDGVGCMEGRPVGSLRMGDIPRELLGNGVKFGRCYSQFVN